MEPTRKQARRRVELLGSDAAIALSRPACRNGRRRKPAARRSWPGTIVWPTVTPPTDRPDGPLWLQAHYVFGMPVDGRTSAMTERRNYPAKRLARNHRHMRRGEPGHHRFPAATWVGKESERRSTSPCRAKPRATPQARAKRLPCVSPLDSC